MPKLIVINQRGITKLVPLPQGQTTVGRCSLNSVVIDAESVSRNHAVLTRDDDIVRLQDLGSRNGTYVNDVRVRARRLRHGDTISIGDYTLRFLCDITAQETPPDGTERIPSDAEFPSVYSPPQAAQPGWDARA